MWSTATSTGLCSTDADAEAEEATAEEATEAEVCAALPNYYALCWQLEATLRGRGRVSDPAAGARLLARSKELIAQYRVCPPCNPRC